MQWRGPAVASRNPTTVPCLLAQHAILLTLFIFATAAPSGGHLNPTITFATMCTGHTPPFRALIYVIAQVRLCCCCEDWRCRLSSHPPAASARLPELWLAHSS